MQCNLQHKTKGWVLQIFQVVFLPVYIQEVTILYYFEVALQPDKRCWMNFMLIYLKWAGSIVFMTSLQANCTNCIVICIIIWDNKLHTVLLFCMGLESKCTRNYKSGCERGEGEGEGEMSFSGKKYCWKIEKLCLKRLWFLEGNFGI